MRWLAACSFSTSLFVAALVVVGCASTPQADEEADVMLPPPPPTVSAITRAPAPEPPPRVREDESAAAFAACVEAVREGDPAATADPHASVYQRALAAENAGKLDLARKGYFEVVQGKGSFVPLAYLAFGILFEQESRADPTKLAFAQQSYEQVVKYPDSRAALLARYFLSRVHSAMGEHAKAIDALARAKPPADDGTCGPPLLAAVKRDIATGYAAFGAPQKAYAFFRRTFDDAGAADVVVRLAENYRAAAKLADAQEAVAAALSALTNPPPRLCEEGRRLRDAAPSPATSKLVQAMSVCVTP